jgi:hypothetical protein
METVSPAKADSIDTISRAEAPKLGERAFGGIMLGSFFLGDQHRIVIRSPAKYQIDPMPWNSSMSLEKAALSYNDGAANTAAMAKAGSQLAKTILELEIEGIGGWYLWSQLEALICFGNSRLIKLPEAEKFRKEWYWTSTQCPHPSDSGYAFVQSFDDGLSFWNHKSSGFRGFAVRSLAVI